MVTRMLSFVPVQRFPCSIIMRRTLLIVALVAILHGCDGFASRPLTAAGSIMVVPQSRSPRTTLQQTDPDQLEERNLEQQENLRGLGGYLVPYLVAGLGSLLATALFVQLVLMP